MCYLLYSISLIYINVWKRAISARYQGRLQDDLQ